MLMVPRSVVRRRKIIRPCGGVCRSSCPSAGNARRPGALSARRLEGGLVDRREHRDDLHTQAGTHPAADHPAILMRSLKSRVVVKLGEGRQLDLAPVPEQVIKSRPRGERRAWPGANQPAVEGTGGQDLDLEVTLHHEALHEIEGIEFRLVAGDLRQVPAAGWRRSPHAAAAVERGAAFENPANRPNDRNAAMPARRPCVIDRTRPVLAEVADLLELSAQLQDQVFCRAGCAVNGLGDRGSVLSQIPCSNRCSPARATQGWAVHKLTPWRQATECSDVPWRTRGYHVVALLETSVCFFMLALSKVTSITSLQAGLWKLPELWKHRTLPQAPWKTTERVFHSYHRPSLTLRL